MTSELDKAFALLRATLEGESPEAATMDASSWWSLFRLMQQNHVAPLCAEAAKEAGAPRFVLMPWLAEREKTVQWQRHQQSVQQEIADTMARHNIETLVLKGTHTAQYYPRPEERDFGDLDLYFYSCHDDADRVAREELRVEVSNDGHHHSKYNFRGVTVESHYDFVNTHYPPSNRRYETLLKELAPSATFEVLFLLRHMACHFAASRITLRDLVDWTLTCRALREQVDWKQVQSVVDNSGMSPFATALNQIMEKRLGTTLPLSRQEHEKDILAGIATVEHDLVYGNRETDDTGRDGLSRLPWKLHRWRATKWKRRMVFCDSEPMLLWASLTSHAKKPRSILHKM